MPNPQLVAGNTNSGSFTSGTSVTVSSTGSVPAGYLMFCVLTVGGATAPSALAPPAGWTTYLTTTANTGSGLIVTAIFYRQQPTTGAFSGSFSWTTTATSGRWAFFAYQLQGALLVDGSVATSQNASGTKTSPSVTPGAGNVNDVLIVGIIGAVVGTDTLTVPTGTTSIVNLAGSASQPFFAVAGLALASSGATGAQTWTIPTSRTCLGFSLLIQQGPVWGFASDQSSQVHLTTMRPATMRQRYAATRQRSEFAYFGFQPYGFDAQPFQPPRLRREKAAAIMAGDQGNVAPFVPPSTTPPYLPQDTFTALPPRRARNVGETNDRVYPSPTTFAPLDLNWYPHIAPKRPRPVGWPDWNDDGNYIPIAAFVPFVEQTTSAQRWPFRTFRKTDISNRDQTLPPFTPPAWGFEIMPAPLRAPVRRAGSLASGELTFPPPANPVWGFEVASIALRLGAKRSGLLAGADGNQFAPFSAFVPFVEQQGGIALRWPFTSGGAPGKVIATGDLNGIPPSIPLAWGFEVAPAFIRTNWRRGPGSFAGGEIIPPTPSITFVPFVETRSDALRAPRRRILPTGDHTPIFTASAANVPLNWGFEQGGFALRKPPRPLGALRQRVYFSYFAPIVPWGFESTLPHLRQSTRKRGLAAGGRSQFGPTLIVATPPFVDSPFVYLRKSISNRGWGAGGQSQFAAGQPFVPYTLPQDFQPPYRHTRGAFVRGIDGTDLSMPAAVVPHAWFEGFLPTLRRPVRRLLTVSDLPTPPIQTFVPYVLDQGWQPFRKRRTPFEAIHMPPMPYFFSTVPLNWGFEAAGGALRIRPNRLGALAPMGDGGIVAPFRPFVPHVDSVLPTLRRRLAVGGALSAPEKPWIPAATPAWGWDQGGGLILRRRRPLAGALAGDQTPLPKFVPPIAWGYEQGGLVIKPRRRVDGVILQAAEFTFINPVPVIPWGFEPNVPFPPQPRNKRAAAIMAGQVDAGSWAPLIALVPSAAVANDFALWLAAQYDVLAYEGEDQDDLIWIAIPYDIGQAPK